MGIFALLIRLTLNLTKVFPFQAWQLVFFLNLVFVLILHSVLRRFFPVYLVKMPEHFPLIFKMVKYSALRLFGTLCKVSCFINSFHSYMSVYLYL